MSRTGVLSSTSWPSSSSPNKLHRPSPPRRKQWNQRRWRPATAQRPALQAQGSQVQHSPSSSSTHSPSSVGPRAFSGESPSTWRKEATPPSPSTAKGPAGPLTGFAETQDAIAMCAWVNQDLSPHGIVLGGSAAGAPIAGSAVDKIDEAVGYVSLGYPFGMTASILFGKSQKLKLFVVGTKDGFTSVKQLQNKLKSAAGRVETHLLGGVGHFQMEGPAYDDQMVDLIATFVQSLQQ